MPSSTYHPGAPLSSSVFEVEGRSRSSQLAQLALNELEEHDYTAAAQLARQGLAVDCDEPWCQACLAVCAAACGDVAESRDMARGIIRDHGVHPAGYYALGHVFLLEGNRRQAFRNFAQAREAGRRDRSLLSRLDRQDPRSSPVLGNVSRDHYLNRFLGYIRSLLRRS